MRLSTRVRPLLAIPASRRPFPEGTDALNRTLVALRFLSILACLPGSARGQNGDLPWTVTASPVDSQSVAVHLSGSWIGCAPHDPQFMVVGNQIEVLLIASNINECLCIPLHTSTNETVLVTGLSPGPHDVRAAMMDCGAEVLLGTTSVVVEACTPTAHTLCLNDHRFAVTASYTSVPQGLPVQATAVPLTADTGYFWFFDPANVELVVKVLDGCAVNGHAWVFAGGLTNVNVLLQVIDTRTGTMQSYSNALGTAFQPVQDSSAFPCP
jgi:hypothetical protein